LHQFKSQYAAIKVQRSLEIGDLEMHVPDPRLGINRTKPFIGASFPGGH
jgi:hypothetical protein